MSTNEAVERTASAPSQMSKETLLEVKAARPNRQRLWSNWRERVLLRQWPLGVSTLKATTRMIRLL